MIMFWDFGGFGRVITIRQTLAKLGSIDLTELRCDTIIISRLLNWGVCTTGIQGSQTINATLQTERLFLRLCTADDLDLFTSTWGDAEVTQTFGPGVPVSPEYIEQNLNEYI